MTPIDAGRVHGRRTPCIDGSVGPSEVGVSGSVHAVLRLRDDHLLGLNAL